MTNEFLSDLFGDQEGIVYSPVKGEVWNQHFFEWPNQRELLEAHLENYDKREVYVSPVLFSEKRIAPETFKGTQYLWTEFDGTLPTEFIEPSMRILSSQEGHEHWYWRLNEFQTSKVLVEDLTKRIAYHYSADLSVWDYQNVLRPTDTWNHKRNKPVTLLTRTQNVYSIDSFLRLPIPTTSSRLDFSLGTLPRREEILAKYKWKENTLDLLFKVVATGGRSTGLARVALDAIEAGCSNEEAYVLVEDCDSRWGKYTGRTDREKQLKACIAYARTKKATTAEITQSTTEVYRFHDFMKTDIRLRWAIEGLLPVAGSMVIIGKEGIGKSTFSLRTAMNLALGVKEFLTWKIATKQKTLFISLEMQHGELKEFFNDMKLSEEEQEALQDGFHIWPIGHAYPFDTPDQQLELLKFIDLHKIELVIIDSLSLSMYGSIKNDDDVKRLNAFFNEDLRKDRKCGYILIHHLRKQGTGEESRVSELDDSFGSRFITSNAQTVLLLSQRKGSPRLTVKFLKTRMTQGVKEFDIERTPDRGFKIAGTPDPVKHSSSVGGEAEGEQKGVSPVFGKLG